MKKLKVSFEYVNPKLFPGYFHGSDPIPDFDPAAVPDEHWLTVENVGDPDSIMDQFGELLIQWLGENQPIRNVCLYVADVDSEDWHEIKFAKSGSPGRSPADPPAPQPPTDSPT